VAEGTARGLPLDERGGQPLTMKMKTINHKPMIRLEGTIAF